MNRRGRTNVARILSEKKCHTRAEGTRVERRERERVCRVCTVRFRGERKNLRPSRPYDVAKESLDWSFRANEKLSTVIRIVAICGNNGRTRRTSFRDCNPLCRACYYTQSSSLYTFKQAVAACSDLHFVKCYATPWRDSKWDGGMNFAGNVEMHKVWPNSKYFHIPPSLLSHRE